MSIMMIMDFKYVVEIQRYFKLLAKILGEYAVFTNTVPAGNDRANAPKEEFCSAEIPSVTCFSNCS